MARFGSLIEKYRLEADKTLDSVANLLGVSAAYVSEVELGKKPPFNRVASSNLPNSMRWIPNLCWSRPVVTSDLWRWT